MGKAQFRQLIFRAAKGAYEAGAEAESIHTTFSAPLPLPLPLPLRIDLNPILERKTERKICTPRFRAHF